MPFELAREKKMKTEEIPYGPEYWKGLESMGLRTLSPFALYHARVSLVWRVGFIRYEGCPVYGMGCPFL